MKRTPKGARDLVSRTGARPITGNRLMNKCSGCGADRYYKCMAWHTDIETGEKYPVIKEDICSARIVTPEKEH